jgi:cytochrome c biogenesis factor
MNLIPKTFAQSPFSKPDPTGLTIGPGNNFHIQNIGTLISSVANILLIVAAIAAFLFLVLGGLQWITSGGDKAGMEQARNKITHAIVGLIIVAAAYAIMLLVSNFLGLNVFGSELQLPQAF